jgi:pilus assembly protein Flp/PilA
MVRYLQSLRQREDGQALVEYALILGLIAVLAIGALTLLGENVTSILSTIANEV